MGEARLVSLVVVVSWSEDKLSGLLGPSEVDVLLLVDALDDRGADMGLEFETFRKSSGGMVITNPVESVRVKLKFALSGR